MWGAWCESEGCGVLGVRVKGVGAWCESEGCGVLGVRVKGVGCLV